MKNKKRLLALAMTASMAATMMVGCGSKTAGNGSGKGSEAASNGSAAGITIYNSKTEIQSQMEDIAKAYTKETGVPVEVTVQGTGSTVATDLSTAYASGNPYTISMVDAKDIYSMGKEHAVDLSGEEWTKNTNYAIGVDSATYGMPICIEASQSFLLILVAFALAYLVTRGIKGQNFFRAGFFVPNLIGGIVLGYVWQFVFNRAFVSIASAISGGNVPSLLATEAGAMFCLILVSVWQYAGYMMLIYVAGFMSVPESLKEAALIDGCNPGQALRKIILAYSLDGGETLLPYPAFELAEYTRENRDPKILWHEASKSYIMVLFLEANAFAILRSTDLLHWEKTQEFSYPPMWECPDLFCLRRGEEEVWAFTSADGFYYLGSFDGREFHEIQEMQSLFDTKGVSPYASQTAFGTDGRIVQISWLRTENHGELWNGLMSIPREFTLGGEEGSYYIKQEFIRESSSFTKEIDGRTVISDRLARESLDAEGRILHVDQSF